jgi:cytochrome c-type biogenesis protein CcmH/NrfG
MLRDCGDAMIAVGDMEGAASAYEASSSLDASSPSVFVGLARVASSRGDAAGAREARRRALALDPYNAQALALPGN